MTIHGPGDGSITQNGLRFYSSDHMHERMYHTVVGVVLNVYASDSRVNQSAIPNAAFKGSRCEARVLVTNEGHDHPWIIPNVVILPQGSSGTDNYYEEIPTAATQMIDGSGRDEKGVLVDPDKLDGDFCVVGFVGGDIRQPYMIGWWPHPGNNKDPATSNETNRNYLEQGRRVVRRFQGTKLAITSKGSLFIDTSEANADVSYGSTGIKRKRVEDGGDIRLDVKSSRTLEVNFNPPVPNPPAEPDLLQPNPPRGEREREDLLSRMLMNKDFINAVAGRVVQIMGNNDGTDNKDTVLLGENPTDHLLLGEKVQATFNALVANVNALRDAYESHFHTSNTPTGPTSGPIDVTPTIAVPANSISPGVPPFDQYAPVPPQAGTGDAQDMPDTDLSEVVVTE